MQKSKLSALQKWWLSKAALFDFNIKFRPGKSKQATDFFRQCQLSSKSSSESDTEVISYFLYANWWICTWKAQRSALQYNHWSRRKQNYKFKTYYIQVQSWPIITHY